MIILLKYYYNNNCNVIDYTINELDKIHNPIDHINGNCLDNRKSNLRICTISDNMYNTYRQRNNSTGVRKHIQKGKYISYQAYISINNKQINLGYFDTKEKAIAGMEDYLNIKIMFLLVDILILVYYMNMILIKDGCLKKQYILIVLK